MPIDYKNYKKRIVFFVVCFLIIVALFYTQIGYYVNLEQLRDNRDYLHSYIADHYARAVFIYIGLYVLVTSLLLPLAAVLTFSGGYFFGPGYCALYTNIGAIIGGTTAFFLVRYLIGSLMQERYAPRLAAFNAAFKEDGIEYLLAIRFISVIPGSVINVLAGLTKIDVWTFIWTTSVGTIPGSLVFAFAGRQLMSVASVKDVFTVHILLAFLLLGLLALMPTFYKKLKNRTGS